MSDLTALIEQAHQGDKAAREELIEGNLGLVHCIVKRFLNRGYDAEDLFQIGTIGLMKAIDKFDCSFEVKFSTYAVPMIQGEIKRFLRDDGLIKVSRSIKENGWKLKRATEQLSYELGREATLEELVSLTGLTVEEIVMAMEANVEVESIYKPVYQSDGHEICLIDQVPGEGEACSSETEKLINHMVLEQLMETLEQTERELIVMRYFHNKTQMEVAGKLGISQVQVSRLEKRILLRMRKEMAGV